MVARGQNPGPAVRYTWPEKGRKGMGGGAGGGEGKRYCCRVGIGLGYTLHKNSWKGMERDVRDAVIHSVELYHRRTMSQHCGGCGVLRRYMEPPRRIMSRSVCCILPIYYCTCEVFFYHAIGVMEGESTGVAVNRYGMVYPGRPPSSVQASSVTIVSSGKKFVATFTPSS